MGQIQTATYAGTSSAVNYHQITFGSAQAGKRLMVVVSSQVDISDYPSGWTYLVGAGSSSRRIAIFTKIASGGENYFWVDLVSSTRVCHMFMAERDDTLMYVSSVAGVDDNDSMSVDFPKGGYIIGGVHYGGTYVEYVESWPRSLYTSHRATHSNTAGDYNLSSSFAHRAFAASGFTFHTSDVDIDASGWAYAFAAFGPDSVAPSTPSGLSLSNKTSTSATLSWSPSSDNVAVTGYSLYVNGSWIADTTNTSYNFSSLASGVPLSLGVAAYDALANRSSIAAVSVTLDGTPPSMPTKLRLTEMTTTSLTVAWNPSTDAGGLAGYGIWVNGIKLADQTGTTRVLTGLTTNQQYVIEIDAYDTSGNRSTRATLRATPKVDTTPPEQPKPLVTALSAGTISIGWDEPHDDSAVATYSVYLGNTKVADQAEQEYTLTGLTPGGLYVVGVEAVDLSGNRSTRGTRSIKAQADTTPPTVPANLRAVATTQTSITIAWDPSTDDNAGISSYRVYLGGNALADIGSQVYTITGLSPGIGYRFAVDAVDQVGNRSAKTFLTVDTKADLSGAAPPYEYALVDWATHEPIDSLPLQGVSFELTLDGRGELPADIPLYDAAYTIGRVAAATRPERTMLLAYRGDRLVWGGRVIDPQDYTSETGVLRITAEEVVGIYARRFVSFTGPRAATYAHTELTWLLEHNASAADLRWLTYAGVAGSVAVDREYRQEDFQRILDVVSEVASSAGGFDWWVKPSWDPINDRPRFELRRVSRTSPPDTGLVLEYPGNVRTYTRATTRGLETKTYGKLSTSDGGVLLSSASRPDLTADGWPLLEEAYQFEGITSQAALDAETARASAAAAGPKHVYQFTLMPGAGVKWWDLEIGGLAQVVISDHLYPEREDGSPGLDRAMKIVSVKVTPDSEQGEQVVISTGEFTVEVD